MYRITFIRFIRSSSLFSSSLCHVHFSLHCSIMLSFIMSRKDSLDGSWYFSAKRFVLERCMTSSSHTISFSFCINRGKLYVCSPQLRCEVVSVMKAGRVSITRKKSLSNPRSSFACHRWATRSRMHWPPWANLPKLADQTMP